MLKKSKTIQNKNIQNLYLDKVKTIASKYKTFKVK